MDLTVHRNVYEQKESKTEALLVSPTTFSVLEGKYIKLQKEIYICPHPWAVCGIKTIQCQALKWMFKVKKFYYIRSNTYTNAYQYVYRFATG